MRVPPKSKGCIVVILPSHPLQPVPVTSEHCSLHFVAFASRDRGKREDTSVTMASGFSPPSDERSRSRRGSDSSNPGANVRDLVPAVSVLRTRTQSRPRTQPQAAGSDGTSTPSPSPQPAPSLSSQQATSLAGAAIQSAHQASHMASSAASSALQGHQAAVFARARERQTEEQAHQVVGQVRSEAHQVVDHVRSEARAFGHQVVTETQAEATRFKQDLERQAREILASAPRP